MCGMSLRVLFFWVHLQLAPLHPPLLFSSFSLHQQRTCRRPLPYTTFQQQISMATRFPWRNIGSSLSLANVFTVRVPLHPFFKLIAECVSFMQGQRCHHHQCRLQMRQNPSKLLSVCRHARQVCWERFTHPRLPFQPVWKPGEQQLKLELYGAPNFRTTRFVYFVS